MLCTNVKGVGSVAHGLFFFSLSLTQVGSRHCPLCPMQSSRFDLHAFLRFFSFFLYYPMLPLPSFSFSLSFFFLSSFLSRFYR
ncbi:hypothetical protein F5H01DRAFT_109165 [Linnemannia elongata]|nr:hypothetical protein F5H01DRAFT_109165 [Linnemannia elongata]